MIIYRLNKMITMKKFSVHKLLICLSVCFMTCVATLILGINNSYADQCVSEQGLFNQWYNAINLNVGCTDDIVAQSYFDNGVCYDGIYYDIDFENGTANLVNGKNAEGDIKIPEFIEYDNKQYMVKRINDYAFLDCNSISSIYISDNVESIGLYAFNNCTNLKSVQLPSKLKSIENFTFNLCRNLSFIIIPDSVEYIDSYAFCDCSSLPSIVIPNSVNKINWCAFMGCTSLGSVQLSNNLKEIYNDVFRECKSLSSIVIPDSVEKINNLAFADSGLNKIFFMGNRPQINCRAFLNIDAVVYFYSTSFDWDVNDLHLGGAKQITYHEMGKSLSFSINGSIYLPDVYKLGSECENSTVKVALMDKNDNVLSEEMFRYSQKTKSFNYSFKDVLINHLDMKLRIIHTTGFNFDFTTEPFKATSACFEKDVKLPQTIYEKFCSFRGYLCLPWDWDFRDVYADLILADGKVLSSKIFHGPDEFVFFDFNNILKHNKVRIRVRDNRGHIFLSDEYSITTDIIEYVIVR